jgi:hypothetical protein
MSIFQRHGECTTLIVLLHAYSLSPKHLAAVASAVTESMTNADIFIPSLPLSLFSLADPNDIAQEVVKQIDELWKLRSDKEREQKYQKIILVGHSVGALLARKDLRHRLRARTRTHLSSISSESLSNRGPARSSE